MLAEIITIGDEILIGQIVDTNSAYIAKELNKIGIQVYQITSVQDDRGHMLQAFEDAYRRSDVIIVTGGLGPTKDDITKHTLCEFFQDSLVLNKEMLANVYELFEKHLKVPPNKLNEQQALVPSKAIALKNEYGTAPGIWMEKENTVFISLPGVPYEMMGLLQKEVLPRLKNRFQRPVIYHKTILTSGMGESAIAELIEEWEDNLPEEIKLAYLPSLGRVRLRLSTKGTEESALHAAIDNQVNNLKKLIGNIIIGYEGESSVEEVIAGLLVKKNQTLGLAESCTGGYMAKQLTANEGASAYFRGGIVPYATETKTNVLGVSEEIIKKHSVVSAEVAKAMAIGARKLYNVDYAVSTTGVAGPSKGDTTEDVGTVFIAVASPGGVVSERFNFGRQRSKVIRNAANTAFEMLRKEILKN